jgi:hypothetical protein
MDKKELRNDITKVRNYMETKAGLEVRMALDRLLQVLRAWGEA